MCRGENNFDGLKPDDISWRDFFLENLQSVDEADPAADVYPQNPDDVEFEKDASSESSQIRDPGMALARLPPGDQRLRDALGQRVLDQVHIWSNLESVELDGTSISNFLRSYAQNVVPVQANKDLISVSQMSEDQIRVMDC